MSVLNVKYSRAENGIDLTESTLNETVVCQRQRNGLSKLEKILLACIVFLVFVCAIFAGLYFSERQHRQLNNEVHSEEKGEWNCDGAKDGKDGEENERNETLLSCHSKLNRTACSNEVTKQAAVGKS